MRDHYVWLVWSSGFLLPWLALYWGVPARRRIMLRASLLTMPFGLTEPLFVPAYWSPPSLFELAQRTGFDIESLIFSFAIGGVGLVLYDVLTRRVTMRLPAEEHDHRRHRLHRIALVVPVLVFLPLFFLRWNPIYAAIVAMGTGSLAAIACRPDLRARSWVGAALFVAFYTVLLLGLETTVPGYIGRVWNLSALSGLLVAGLPVEELLFAAAFGAYWSAVYEHLTWSTSTKVSSLPPIEAGSTASSRLDAAMKHCIEVVGIWRWASNDEGGAPDVVMACCGDVPTLETLAAVSIMREHLPDLNIRVVNTIDLMRLQPPSEHPHGVTDVVDRLPQTGEKGIALKRELKDKLTEHRRYIEQYGQDMPEIRDWRWGAQRAASGATR